ncbi:DNA polymerase IV [Pseudomonas syringae pv. actinidiae]
MSCSDISSRVQRTIESLAPRVKVYSIDESFADLTGIAEPLGDFAREIQARVRSWTGMPVGIGIGHTKTLAKAAQHASKLYKERTGGVVDLRADHAVEWLLKRMPTQEVWGVGRRISVRLEADGVTTAWQLANTDPIARTKPDGMPPSYKSMVSNQKMLSMAGVNPHC